MAFTRITIEQIAGDRWMAETEAGSGSGFKRAHIKAATFESIAGGALAQHYVRNGFIAAGDGDAFADLLRESLAAAADALSKPAPQEEPAEAPETDLAKDELLALADERGIEIDRRWGVARLREAIFGEAGQADDSGPDATSNEE